MLNLFNWGRRREQQAPDQSRRKSLGFRTAPNVKASLHAEGVVLLHLGRGTVFSANRVGAMIWNGAAERWSLDRLIASISREFQISMQTAQQDTADFLAQLASEGLLLGDAR
jgi:transposase InsO family protein